MTSIRRLVATAVVAALLGAGCGLDDGARVRNQDNVREGAAAVVG